MKHVILAAAVVIAGCATYQGPKASSIIHECYAAGYQVRNLSSCMSAKYEKASDKWREDSDYPAIASFMSFTDALGAEVSEGRMSEPTARIKAEEYLTMLKQQKYAGEAQRQQAAAAILGAGVGMMGVQQQIRANEINSYNSTRPRTCTYQQVGSTVQQVCN